MNKWIVLGVRVVFGLMLLALGAMGFMNLPIPPGYPPDAEAFLVALANTGYMNPVISVVFILVGLMFITGSFVALGALLLAPIIVNILLFHIFLDLKTIWLGLIVAVLNAFVAFTEWDKYRLLFRRK
ncbi:DoxX protein [Candidatus Woesearchaeota archaeon]|nr:DoxX protein [Candidatus Woesearchaeota archaeon]